ncbi:MAG: hypothetical protein GWN99_05015, partial [Gemmatimonadetes bacterium]|nr:hypothetical protein [Gemmatimonadota bacterium]
ARAATKLGAAKLTGEGTLRATGTVETPFLGYETLTAETSVVGLLRDGSQADSASEGEAVEVIL